MGKEGEWWGYAKFPLLGNKSTEFKFVKPWNSNISILFRDIEVITGRSKKKSVVKKCTSNNESKNQERKEDVEYLNGETGGGGGEGGVVSKVE